METKEEKQMEFIDGMKQEQASRNITLICDRMRAEDAKKEVSKMIQNLK